MNSLALSSLEDIHENLSKDIREATNNKVDEIVNDKEVEQAIEDYTEETLTEEERKNYKVNWISSHYIVQKWEAKLYILG